MFPEVRMEGKDRKEGEGGVEEGKEVQEELGVPPSEGRREEAREVRGFEGGKVRGGTPPGRDTLARWG